MNTRKDNWVSVEDSQPMIHYTIYQNGTSRKTGKPTCRKSGESSSDPALVYLNGDAFNYSQMMTASRRRNDRSKKEHWYFGPNVMFEPIQEITHWMYLPLPPKK